jgi:hypothetical protein
MAVSSSFNTRGCLASRSVPCLERITYFAIFHIL